MPNYKRFYNDNYRYVFFTIVTNNRQPILIENIDILRSSFKYVLTKYQFDIYAISILKNHIHMILKLKNNNEYSVIIRLLKYYFSTHIKIEQCRVGKAVACPPNISNSKIKKREKGIWQRRYWEHTIRNENDLNKHLDYIHFNSYKHYKIKPQDWKYSSFSKFVNIGFYEPDWCNFDDKNKINELDFE